ncbi:MAG: hypothetical protein JSV35_01080 [Candidatus Bathyarchaeota archaeon]|nr:MAG: hypothetical protein JSV35_01080 [Candidatus Bathyarchaeota archaeon]
MNRMFNRSTKMFILTLLSVAIVSVSALTYFSLEMQSVVSVTGAAVEFSQGDDWDGAWTLGTNNTWCDIAPSAYPNATLTYDEPVNLTNSGAAVQIRLRTISITPASGQPQVSNFTFINFVLHDETGAIQGSLNFTTTGDTWSTPSMSFQTMDASDEWYISIQTKAAAGATGSTSVNIKIAVDVQE